MNVGSVCYASFKNCYHPCAEFWDAHNNNFTSPFLVCEMSSHASVVPKEISIFILQ